MFLIFTFNIIIIFSVIFTASYVLSNLVTIEGRSIEINRIIIYFLSSGTVIGFHVTNRNIIFPNTKQNLSPLSYDIQVQFNI